MFPQLLEKLFFRPATHPVPGEDAQWIALCPACGEMALWVSRGGLKIGGTEHCYDCGHERETRGFKQSDIDRMKVSSWCHWQKYPKIPFNWHTLKEEHKWRILGITHTPSSTAALSANG